jgi:hypothetical protein
VAAQHQRTIRRRLRDRIDRHRELVAAASAGDHAVACDGSETHIVPEIIPQVEEPAPVVELDAEDERALDRALASVRAGKGSPSTGFARSCSGSNSTSSLVPPAVTQMQATAIDA